MNNDINSPNVQMRNNRELRTLLGTIGLDFPVHYAIKPVANKNELIISDKINYSDVIDFMVNTLKAKQNGDLYVFKKALLKVINDSPVRIEIVSKIDEMSFKRYLEIVLAK